MKRIYLLSPAHCGGQRARVLFNESAGFELARRLRSRQGLMLGEAFSFLSGLYFRGKLAYACAFASPPEGLPGTLVITAGAGLRRPEERVTLSVLRRFAEVPISLEEARYRGPLEHDARRIASLAGPDCHFILLGSIATGKYVDVLSAVFGERLRFPEEFVGRGDMSRGGLLLRCVDERKRLRYVRVDASTRRGRRPPRLAARDAGRRRSPAARSQ